MSDADVIKIVDPIAKKYGVPTILWETVAEVESGMNPKAAGDVQNGKATSFGLFQLHRGGQLGNMSEQDAYDPAKNAEKAMPAIADAWKQLSKGPGGPQITNGVQSAGTDNWWYLFAVKSGHPGADVNAATAEAKKLKNEFLELSRHPLDATNNGNDATRNNYDTSPVDCSALNPGTWTNCVQQYMYAQFVQPVIDHAIKVGIFVLALVLMVVGIWALSREG